MLEELQKRITDALPDMKPRAERFARRYRLVTADGDDILQVVYLTAHESCMASPSLDRHLARMADAAFHRLLCDTVEYAAEVLALAELRHEVATDWGLPSPWEMEDARRVVQAVQGNLSPLGIDALNVFIAGEDPTALAPNLGVTPDTACRRFWQGLAELNREIWRALAEEFGTEALLQFRRRVRIFRYFRDIQLGHRKM